MGKTVIIVEDEKELCELIAMQLEELPIKVIQSYSSTEAFDVISKEPVDLVVTDLTMPEMSGIELADKINKTIDTPPTIYLMTGYSDYSQKDIQKCGIQKLFLKPNDISKLISEVKTFFN